MDHGTFDAPHDSADPCGTEQPVSRGDHALVYGASCPAATAWGRTIGFDVLHIGVCSGDPLAAIRQLSQSDHGRGGMLMDDVDADRVPWDDWVITPICAAITPSDAVEVWGGAIRVHLAAGDQAIMLGRRLATLLSPLRADRAAASPAMAAARSQRGDMPPPFPRFTRRGSRWIPATEIYRWSTAWDADYASRALATALGDPAAEDPLDLLAEGEVALDRVP